QLRHIRKKWCKISKKLRIRQSDVVNLPPEFEVLTEVDISYLFIVSELCGCTLFEDLAFEEQTGPVGYGKGLVYVMVGDKDAYILVLQVRNDHLDVFHGDGVNAGEGFVEKDETGLEGQGACYLCTAP